MPEAVPALEIRDLVAGYGARWVLQGVSLSCAPGELVAVIGPNGHGKTTLLRAASGLIRPQGGQVFVDGAEVTGLRPDRIVAAGLVQAPQGDLLFPGMSVMENLRMGAFLASQEKEAERLEAVFALFPKLKDRAGQVAGSLSGGERRMCGIGRALMADARCLMLDEPSLGLAPIVIDQIFEAIRALRAAGRSILLVEENAERVEALADRIHLLDSGRFVWEGRGVELMARPELVSTYLGA